MPTSKMIEAIMVSRIVTPLSDPVLIFLPLMLAPSSGDLCPGRSRAVHFPYLDVAADRHRYGVVQSVSTIEIDSVVAGGCKIRRRSCHGISPGVEHNQIRLSDGCLRTRGRGDATKAVVGVFS